MLMRPPVGARGLSSPGAGGDRRMEAGGDRSDPWVEQGVCWMSSAVQGAVRPRTCSEAMYLHGLPGQRALRGRASAPRTGPASPPSAPPASIPGLLPSYPDPPAHG